MPRLSTHHRLFWLGLTIFGLELATTPSLPAQDAPGGSSPMARYVPKDNLALYIESQGLDAHADAWQKTAAYKILNTTPTGVMLEEVAAQLFDKLATPGQKPALTGAEKVTLIKHIAKNGMVFAGLDTPDNPAGSATIIVLRNGFKDKTTRGILARGLQSLNGPNTKPVQALHGDHKIVTGFNSKGLGFAWWVEESKKEDIVLVLDSRSVAGAGGKGAGLVLDVLDGKTQSVTSLPACTELFTSENGFTPTGICYINVASMKTGIKMPPAATTVTATLGLGAITKFDYRWGFQDNALMSVTRIGTSGPRAGLLGLFDGPGFDKAKLPPMPEGVGEFTVVALDLKSTMEKAVALAKSIKPELEQQVNSYVDAIKTATKLRLKEDILVHLGPKMAFYTVPVKAGTKAGPTATGLAGTTLSMLGFDQTPRAALVFDIDDPVAFGKVLDQVMAATNKEMKARAVKAVTGDAAPTRSTKGRGPSAPSVEFRLMPGDAKTKTYVLSVPPELASQFPASLRPAIRVGPKHAVLAVTSEVARTVLESKENASLPSDVNSTLQGFQSKLKVLNVSDPRDTLPGILASLPGNLQKAINAGIQLQAKGMGATATAPAAPAGAAGGASKPPSFSASAASGGGAAATPGVAAAGPGGNSASGTTPGTIVLQVDSSKLPSADSIKALLFPSVFAVEANDNEIRFVTREAFPTIPDFAKLLGLSQLGSMMSNPGLASPGGAPGNGKPGMKGNGGTGPAGASQAN